MLKYILATVFVVIMSGSIFAQEPAPNCTPVQAVKAVSGPRGPVGPVGPQGNPGLPGQVPEWYLYLGISGLLFGLLGTGFGFAALLRRELPVVQPVNVINVPVPALNQAPNRV